MKNVNRILIFIVNFLIVTQANAKETSALTYLVNKTCIRSISKEKNVTTEPKTKNSKKKSKNKNFHSVRKWKINIEFTDGGIISKIIDVQENSKLSALEIAFIEGEKLLSTMENVKEYSVSPLSNNSFVLLLE